MEKYLKYQLIEKKEIPTIPLYMDQVTSYLDELFEDVKKNKDEKILTKTMINNYVKASLIDSPIKKKYHQDQLMQLIMIYVLKGTASIHEIETLFKGYEDKEALYEIFKDLYNESILKLDKCVEQSSASIHDRILELLISSSLQKRYAEILIETLKNDA